MDENKNKINIRKEQVYVDDVPQPSKYIISGMSNDQNFTLNISEKCYEILFDTMIKRSSLLNPKKE